MNANKHVGSAVVVAIDGLPGTGKTTFALHLAARRPGTLVLHTDLLKVTLRGLGVYAAGPVWQGDVQARLRAAAPVLKAHVDKAQRDGYSLIVEGTLALACPAPVRWRLEAPAAVRADRSRAKHPAAAAALAHADLDPLDREMARVPPDRVFDAHRPMEALIGEAEAAWPTG